MFRNYFQYIGICLVCFVLSSTQTKAQKKLIQLYGVVMTSDSLRALPAATVELPGKGRGTIANDKGVFSIVVEAGDKVRFSYVGYKDVVATIPTNLQDDQYSLIQLMTEDSAYLPATVIRTHKSIRQLEWEFVNDYVPDDKYEIARKNLEYWSRYAMTSDMPRDAAETYQMRMNGGGLSNNYRTSGPPINILNPRTWSSFVQSWKRGDYRANKQN